MKQHSNPEQVSPVIARTLLEANLLCVGFAPALGLMLQIATSKDADIVGVGFGIASVLRSQIATSRSQPFHPQGFARPSPVTTV